MKNVYTQILFSFFIALLLCCHHEKKTDDQTRSDTSYAKSTGSLNPLDKSPISDFHFKDTTIDNVSFNFRELTLKEFDSLAAYSLINTIPLSSFKYLVQEVDSCQLIKLQNGKYDSLRSFRMKDGYFENYEIKGLWKEKNQLLVSFSNWEESNDFLIDLKDGKFHLLNPIYELAPNKEYLFSYANVSEQPIYTGGFSLSKITDNSAKTILSVELNQSTITSLKWLRGNTCIISEGFWKSDILKIESFKYYKLDIK